MTERSRICRPGSPPIHPSLRHLFQRHRQLCLYTLIGGSAVVVDMGLFWLLQELGHFSIMVNNAVSITVSVIYSFSLNAHFNFRKTDALLRRFAAFAVVCFLGYLLSTALIYLFVSFQIQSVIAKALTLPLVFMLQYLLNRRITFSPRGAGPTPDPSPGNAENA